MSLLTGDVTASPLVEAGGSCRLRGPPLTRSGWRAFEADPAPGGRACWPPPGTWTRGRGIAAGEPAVNPATALADGARR